VSSKKGDPVLSFDGLVFGGLPVKTTRHCPKGMILLLKKGTWKFLEHGKRGFAKDDGNVLCRVTGQDAWNGFYKWYYNHLCVAPNKNGILVGINFPGAV